MNKSILTLFLRYVPQLLILLLLFISNLHSQVLPVGSLPFFYNLEYLLLFILIALQSIGVSYTVESLSTKNGGITQGSIIAGVAWVTSLITIIQLQQFDIYSAIVITSLILAFTLGVHLEAKVRSYVTLLVGCLLALVGVLVIGSSLPGTSTLLNSLESVLIPIANHSIYLLVWATIITLALVYLLLRLSFKYLISTFIVGISLLFTLVLLQIVFGSNPTLIIVMITCYLAVILVTLTAQLKPDAGILNSLVLDPSARLIVVGFIILLGGILIVAPFLDGKLVQEKFYVSYYTELSDSINYYQGRSILFIDASRNRSLGLKRIIDSYTDVDYYYLPDITNTGDYTNLVAGYQVVLVSRSQVLDYQPSLASVTRQEIPGLEFDQDSNMWNSVTGFVNYSPLVQVKVDLDGDSVTLTPQSSQSIDISSVNIGSLQLELLYTGSELRVSAPGRTMVTSNQRFNSNLIVLGVGNQIYGPFSKTDRWQTLDIKDIKYSDLQDIRVYSLRDQNQVKQLFRWLRPNDCNGKEISNLRLQDSNYSVLADDIFCIDYRGPVIESSASTVLTLDLDFDSNARVEICFMLKGECVTLGNSSKTISYEFVDAPRNLTTRVKVLPSLGLRDVSFKLTGGTINEYSLIDILAVNLDNQLVISSQTLKDIPNVSRIEAVTSCPDTKPSNQFVFDLQNIDIQTPIYTCLVAKIQIVDFSGWAILQLDPSNNYDSICLESNNGGCLPLIELNKNAFAVKVDDSHYQLIILGKGIQPTSPWVRGLRVRSLVTSIPANIISVEKD